MSRNRPLASAIVLLVAVCVFAPLVYWIHAKDALFVEPSAISLKNIVPPLPPQDSPAAKAELAELHEIEQSRTPAQVAAAQADEKEQDIFVYRTVLGDQFVASDLPLTAALSTAVHKEEPAFSDPLKTEFHRSRPYQFDATLHPVCGTTILPNSYPSGHTISGYLEAFTLAEMVPEKRQQILARADDYAHNRMVCGVHYPSDLAAGHEIAYAVFGALMANPEFKTELAAARSEIRQKLGLN